jgi:phosphate transport system permease protein
MHTKAMAASLVLLAIVLVLDLGIRFLTWGGRKFSARQR